MKITLENIQQFSGLDAFQQELVRQAMQDTKQIEFNKDFAEFTNKIETVLKEGQGHGYKYAELQDVIKVIKKADKDNKFAFTSNIENINDKEYFITSILHYATNYTISTRTLIPENISILSGGKNSIQQFGAWITYRRRYDLGMLLNIATDKDVDGVVENNQAKVQKVVDGNIVKPAVDIVLTEDDQDIYDIIINKIKNKEKIFLEDKEYELNSYDNFILFAKEFKLTNQNVAKKIGKEINFIKSIFN